MTGKNKNDKDIEKQNEKLEQILDKLTSLESQINDLKSENKSLKDTLTEIKEDNRGLIKRVVSLEKKDNDKEKEILALKNRLAVMEENVDSFEQYSKLDNLIISGLRVLRPYNATALPMVKINRNWMMKGRNNGLQRTKKSWRTILYNSPKISYMLS